MKSLAEFILESKLNKDLEDAVYGLCDSLYGEDGSSDKWVFTQLNKIFNTIDKSLMTSKDKMWDAIPENKTVLLCAMNEDNFVIYAKTKDESAVVINKNNKIKFVSDYIEKLLKDDMKMCVIETNHADKIIDASKG